MAPHYLIRRKFAEIEPFLDAVRTQADSERTALGFLPAPAYSDAAQQGKLLVLLVIDGKSVEYAGHLLFGGIYPQLRVRQICVKPSHRRDGNATKLLRALKSQGEAEGYLSIVANVATDLKSANSFYENNGFATRRLKSGGTSRNRTINVKTLQLETPNLFSNDGEPTNNLTSYIQPKTRSASAPLYAIDLNVFFDVVRSRPRSKDASSVFKAAFNHQIRLAASDEFIKELERNSANQKQDPVLALARQIPSLPNQDPSNVDVLVQLVTALVFPDKSRSLSKQDKSDVIHLCHAISAGAAGYITSDVTVLSARDNMMSQFGLDIIALSEFVELIALPLAAETTATKATRNFHIDRADLPEIERFLAAEGIDSSTFLDTALSKCERLCVSDADGIIAVGAVCMSAAISQPSRSIICARQEHPYSSTIVDFLISEQLRVCASGKGGSIELLDHPGHSITRRVAFTHGYQALNKNSGFLTKIAIGRPVTKKAWGAVRLVLERLGGLKVQEKCPDYEKQSIKVTAPDGTVSAISLFEFESLISPTVLALPHRDFVVVPIEREFADALLGTNEQLSWLDVPEAQFLSRRTYFNTTRAANVMIRGSVIAFYESVRSGGRGAIVALARIVDVTTMPIEAVPEFVQRGAVVEDVKEITKGDRILVTTFDNLIPFPRPVTLSTLRRIECVSPSNFVTASRMSAEQLEKIVLAGFPHE